jgi:glycerol uptake facilitator-like aquaporin
MVSDRNRAQALRSRGGALTDTFAGIRPADVPAFIAAQVAGGAAATMLFRWLVPALPDAADQIVVPHAKKRGSWNA